MVGGVQACVSVALIGAYAVPYGVRARTLRRRGRPVPAWRLASFGAGLALLVVAVSPPVDRAADRRLTVHMAEHLALGDLVPLLVVLGLTGPLLAPVLRLRAVRPLQALAHPVAAVALWAGDLYAWHLRFSY
jgi:putative membrane protein